MKNSKSEAIERKKRIKQSRYTTTTEANPGGTRYGVYHQDTGDMKVMGIGRKGLKNSRDYRSKH